MEENCETLSCSVQTENFPRPNTRIIWLPSWPTSLFVKAKVRIGTDLVLALRRTVCTSIVVSILLMHKSSDVIEIFSSTARQIIPTVAATISIYRQLSGRHMTTIVANVS